MLTCVKEECSMEESACDGELVHIPGKCCPECKSKETLVAELKTWIEEKTCKVEITEETVTFTNDDEKICKSVGPMKVASCNGSCQSGSALFGDKMKASCTCCKPATMKKETTEFECEGVENTVKHSYDVVESCACTACEYSTP